VGSTVTLDEGETGVTCTIVNDDVAPTLKLVKVVVNGSNPGGTAVADDWTLTADAAAPFDDRDISTAGGSGVFETVYSNQGYDLAENGPGDYVAGAWSCDGGSLVGSTVTLDEGETGVTCTIVNTAKAMVTVDKRFGGTVDPTIDVDFYIFSGPRIGTGSGFLGGTPIASDSTLGDADGLLFDGVKLNPDATYTVCEDAVPAGWDSTWWIDADGDGVFGAGETEIFPYNPHATDPIPENFGVLCYDFTLGAGEALAIGIENTPPPGGGQRTIGYWKNWSTCTKGNQAATAASNGGAAEGFYLVDDLLPQTIGDLTIDNCEDAVSILDKRDINNGKKRAGDAAFALAAQLLAAQLNVDAGAGTCAAATQAIADAQQLLDDINFNGTGSYFKGSNSNGKGNANTGDAEQAALAHQLAAILDAYNNGLLC
jgi:hypothetical protein